MHRSTRIAVPLALLFTFAITGSVTRAADLQPYQTVRSLQALEDQIASGDTIAQAAHAKAIGLTVRHFVALKPDVWRDSRNARALVGFVFSGGDAAAIEAAIPRTALPKDDEALYDGALAYGRGDDTHARAVLLPIDAAKLPSGLAGHLALVQATLSEAKDKPKALASLDLARLLAPGTLVEEAALRKEIGLLLPDGDFDKLSLLARRYQAGFAHSVYAANFRQIIFDAAIHAAAADSPVGNDRLDRLTASLQRDDRRRILLVVARRETIAGHSLAAGFAADLADRLVSRGDRDDMRARLYRGASAIAGTRYDQALEDLRAVSDEQLDAKDKALHSSALSIAAVIHRTSMDQKDNDGIVDNAVLDAGSRSLAEAGAVLGTMKP